MVVHVLFLHSSFFFRALPDLPKGSHLNQSLLKLSQRDTHPRELRAALKETVEVGDDMMVVLDVMKETVEVGDGVRGDDG